MALKNAFGGLALDQTIKELIERFRDWKDPSWVTSHPDMPVHVAGKTAPQTDPGITGFAKYFTSLTTIQLFAAPNPQRQGFSIYSGSATAALYVLAANNGTVSGLLFSVPILPGQYWELPQGVGGCYKGPITGVWTAVDSAALVTEWTGS